MTHPLVRAWRMCKAQYDGPSRYIWAFSIFPWMVETWGKLKYYWASPSRYIWAFSIFPATEELLRGKDERADI